MKYFRNTELAKIYNVSEKSVRNWVQAAQEGKIELQLYAKDGKHFVANTTQNTAVIEKQVQKGKKYKNSRSFKVISPVQKFYDLFSTKQILDIVTNLDVHREIPYQYTYFDGGAKYWDLYAKRLYNEKTPNSLTSTIQLLTINRDYLDTVLDGRRVNVIDIGVGNCLPVKDLLQHFLSTGQLNRYIGIDLSNELLEIAQENLTSWFGNRIKFEKHVRDIRYERFSDLLVEDSFQTHQTPPVNIVLFLGGTISNLREADQSLQTINSSLGRDDLFIISRKLDTEKARRHFDFDIEAGSISLAPQDKFILDLMNIDETTYEVEQFFDQEANERVIQIRAKIDLSIKFVFNGYQKIIEIHKGENVILWRSKHQRLIDVVKQFERNSFSTIQTAKSKDQEYLMLTSKIKSS